MSFPLSVAGVTLVLRNSDIWKEFRVKPVLFRIERSQFRWFIYGIRFVPKDQTNIVFKLSNKNKRWRENKTH